MNISKINEVFVKLTESNEIIRNFEKEFEDLIASDGVYLFTDNNTYNGPFIEFCIADNGVYDYITDKGFNTLLQKLDTDEYKIKNDKYEIEPIHDDGFGINLAVLPNQDNMPTCEEIKADLKELAKKIKDLMNSNEIEKIKD